MSQRRDRGSATLFVVLALPVLFIASALVFDGGRGYVARRETQNAADAGALAKATDCAQAITTTAFTPYQTNGASLANTPTCGSGTTVVSMSKTISYMFRPGGGTGTVTRSATARWSTLGSASTTPIVISSCEFTAARLNGDTDIFFYLDDPSPWSGCSSLPGGFSQLENDNCAIFVTAGSGFEVAAQGQAGNALQRIIPCITNPTSPELPRDVLIAIYNAAVCGSGCRGNGVYPIAGFAMIRVTGYRLNGNNVAGVGMPNQCPDRQTRGRYCLRGDFIRSVTSIGTPGSSTNFGLLQVALQL